MNILILLVLACDTHTLEFKESGDGLSCGPGTHEENGQCLPDEATDTDTGSERENTAPSAPVLAISPENPTQLSDLSCTVATPSVDAEGDAITYQYAWFVHGVESAITDAVVPESETLLGDTWTCRVTASDGELSSAAVEASVTLAQGFSEISVGTYHGCGIAPNHLGEVGEVLCWGGNLYGEGSPSGSFVHLFAGYYETCGLDGAGVLSCWGTVSWGMDTPPSGAMARADLGYYSGYAVSAGGELAGWGYADPAPEGQYMQIAAGEYDFCALDRDGLIDCWGNNPNGEGNAPAGEFMAIAGGYHNFCALDTDGYPSCWGMYDEVNAAPREVLGSIEVYDGNACGIRGDGSLVCWGEDAVLVADTPSGAFRQVSLGERVACGVDLEGRLSCWGTNQ